MKPYPSIPNSDKFIGLPTIAFHKYDGSNLRFEWSKKTGWYKFGTRTRLFDINDPEFSAAIPLFKERFGEPLSHLFSKVFKCDNAIVFCEWFGPNSFSGIHLKDDPMQLVLLDVNVHKKGFISPSSFVEIFPRIVPSAEVVYRGVLGEDFVKSVREQSPGEGVVCKGGEGHGIWMCKIKTNAYLEKLKEKFGHTWKTYWE